MGEEIEERIKLPAKREIFTLGLFEGQSQRVAYRKAYPRAVDWKDSAVDATASKLANNTKVLQRLSQLRKEAEERTGVTIDKLVAELAKPAFFDPRRMFDDNGHLKEINQLDGDTARSISEITVRIERSEEGELPAQIVKIKAVCKLGAIDKLMKNLGGYEKDNNQGNKVLVGSLNDFYAKNAKDKG